LSQSLQVVKGVDSTPLGLLEADGLYLPVRQLASTRAIREFAWEARTMFEIANFARMLSRATGTHSDNVGRYCDEAVNVAHRLCQEWEERPGFAQSPLGRFTLTPLGRAYAEALYVTVRCVKPAHMVETGVWRGVSTAFELEALERNGSGRLHSIDLPTYAPVGRINDDGRRDLASVSGPENVGDLIDGRQRGVWDLRLGDAREILPGLLDELGGIDLFFHDSEHSYRHMLFEYELAWEHLRPGGWLMSDDVTWSPGTRAAWCDFIRQVGGNPYRYFGPDGSRGLLQRTKEA
jgi:predicted O-methyltransferase YrrM